MDHAIQLTPAIILGLISESFVHFGIKNLINSKIKILDQK